MSTAGRTDLPDSINPPWRPAVDALVLPHWSGRLFRGGEPGSGGGWKPALEATGLFGPLRQVEVDHEQVLYPDGFVALIGSYSWIANLPPAERIGVLARVRAHADRSAAASRRRSCPRGSE